MSEEEKLVRIGEPNLNRLAEYCKALKGYGTSLELAEKVGVNASTISRIINGKLSGPITEDTIKRLAELVLPEHGFTKGDLYRANGMADPNQQYRRDIFELRRQLEQEVSDIIFSAISSKGNNAWKYTKSQRFSFGKYYYAFPSLLLETDAVEDEDRPENHNWAFQFILDPINSSTRSESMRQALIGRRTMEILGTYITLFFQSSEDYETDYEYHQFPLKLSFVFTSLDSYEAAKDRFKDMKVPMEVSLLYVSPEEGRVVNEMPLRSINGYRYNIYFDNNYTFFDDDDNEISEKEWYNLVEEEIEQYMQTKKNVEET